MSKVIGPVLAVGAMTMVTQTVFHRSTHAPVNWRIPLATGLTAVTMSMLEKVLPKTTQMLAWTMVIAVAFTPVAQPYQNSFVGEVAAWWDAHPGPKNAW